MQFAFRGAMYRRVGTEPGTPLGIFEGVAVAVVREGTRSFLLVDYRRCPERPSWVEIWMPATPHEGIEALLVLADATRVSVAERSTLGEAVEALALTWGTMRGRGASRFG